MCVYVCVCAFVGEIEEEKGKGHGLNEGNECGV